MERIGGIEKQLVRVEVLAERTAQDVKEMRHERLGRTVDALVRTVEDHGRRLGEVEVAQAEDDAVRERRAGGLSLATRVALIAAGIITTVGGLIAIVATLVGL